MPPPELPEALRRRLAALAAPRETGWLPDETEAAPAALAPRGRAGIALLAVAAAVVAAVALRAWLDRPRAAGRDVASVAATRSPAGPDDRAAAGSTGLLVVDVEGAVAHPGIQRLPHGSRVADALRAATPQAGAATASLNLARLLVDGEQLVVPVRGSPAATPGAAGGPTPGPDATSGAVADGAGEKLDLNTATSEQLQQLDGVGPVLADRIVEWRTEHGRFSSVEDLREVSGIGPRKYERLAAQVRV